MEIHPAQLWAERRFLRASSGKKRTVQNGHCRLPGWIRNGDWENAGILVVHAVELDAVIRTEGRQPKALPAEQVLG